jgi:hypothetical protein
MREGRRERGWRKEKECGGDRERENFQTKEVEVKLRNFRNILLDNPYITEKEYVQMICKITNINTHIQTMRRARTGGKCTVLSMFAT